MSRRLTPRGKERRQQLLSYATERFAANGYHPTSVAEICEGLGVGKGVFYWYFESKEQLFVEILREAHNAMRRRQQHAIDEFEDPVDRIEAGIKAGLLWLAEHPELFQLIQFAQTEQQFTAALRAGRSVAVSDTVGYMKDAIVAGRIRQDDPEILAHAVLGVTFALASVYLHERREEANAVVQVAVAFCLNGLRANAPPQLPVS